MKPILTLFALFLLCGALFSQTAKAPASYRFIVLGDRSGSPRPGIFPAVIAKAMSLSPVPAFYINVGDLIQGYTSDTAELRRQWGEVKAELKPLTDKFPFHGVPGNHDITDSSQLPSYLKFAGKPFYSFNHGPDHFIVLDNSRGDGILAGTERQMAWLKADLAKAKKARYTFCFYHMPKWDLEPAGKQLDTLHAIFKNGGVDAVINGHYHNYQYGVRDDIQYVVLGSSGGASDLVKSTGTVYQFLVADISPDKIDMRPHLLDGDTMRIDWIEKNKLILMQGIYSPIWVDDPSKKSGAITVEVKNAFKAPLSVRLFWEVPGPCGWDITPDTMTEMLAPSASRTFSFTAKTAAAAPCAVLHAEYRWPGDSLVLAVTPGMRRQLDLVNKAGKLGVDGELDEQCWTALLKRPENRFGNGDTAADSTWIGLAYDKDNLYLAWLCWERDMDSQTTLTSPETRDNVSPKESQIRFYVADKGVNDSFVQVQINIAGSLLDMRVRDGGENWENDRSWDGVNAWKVKKLKDRWQGEIALPWKAMGFQGPETLRFNCRRASNRETTFQEPYERHPKRFSLAVLKK